MIEAVDHGGALQRPEVTNLLHHADQRAIAGLVAAKRAGTLRIDIAAGLAGEDGVTRLGQRGGQRLEQPLDLRACCYARHSQKSFKPGGSGRPPVRLFIFSFMASSTLALASACAATSR